jgi:hypothetical protein
MQIVFREKSDAAFDDLVTRRLHAVRSSEDAALAAASTTSGDDDLRRYVWPPQWRTDDTGIVTFSSSSSETVAYNCTEIAGTLDTTRPPPELYVTLYALLSHQFLVAAERVCQESNQVPTFDDESDSDNVYSCGCAPGHVCADSTTVDHGLVWALIGVTLFAFVGVTAATLLSVTCKARLWDDRSTVAHV